MNATKTRRHALTMDCQQCHRQFEIEYKYRNERKYCSKECTRLALLDLYRNYPNKIGFQAGAQNISWKGGTYSKTEAYVPRGQTLREKLSGRAKSDECDICGKTEKEICFDHDHATGKFRGWICHKCNRALGNVDDSVEILEKMIKYLRKCQKKQTR